MSNITIYHKDYCPYCKAAKLLLKAKGFDYKAIEVTNDPTEFANMVKLSKRRTVPQIFVGNKHIGGFDDLQLSFAEKTFPVENVCIE
jgi:glutaredoxin 3